MPENRKRSLKEEMSRKLTKEEALKRALILILATIVIATFASVAAKAGLTALRG